MGSFFRIRLETNAPSSPLLAHLLDLELVRLHVAALDPKAVPQSYEALRCHDWQVLLVQVRLDSHRATEDATPTWQALLERIVAFLAVRDFRAIES